MSDTEILQSLHPHLAAKAQLLIQHMDQKGHPIRLTSGYRSPDEQARLYAQGRTTPGARVTNARPGMSWHNWGRAFDVCFLGGPAPFSESHPWAKLGRAGQSLGLEWGGAWTRFQDRPHFQLPGPLGLNILTAGLNGELTIGSSSALVTILQEALNQVLEPAIEADGHFGPTTEHTVMRWQTWNSLPATGEADIKTLLALETALEGGV